MTAEIASTYSFSGPDTQPDLQSRGDICLRSDCGEAQVCKFIENQKLPGLLSVQRDEFRS